MASGDVDTLNQNCSYFCSPQDQTPLLEYLQGNVRECGFAEGQIKRAS